MDMEKRKREEEDEKKMMNNTKKKMATETKDEEEEVEEFFAILRRIREAVKYFEADHGSGRVLMAKVWEPSFQVGDFDGDNDAVKDLPADTSGLDFHSEHAPPST